MATPELVELVEDSVVPWGFVALGSGRWRWAWGRPVSTRNVALGS